MAEQGSAEWFTEYFGGRKVAKIGRGAMHDVKTLELYFEGGLVLVVGADPVTIVDTGGNIPVRNMDGDVKQEETNP